MIAAAQAGKHNEKRESYGDTLIIDPWGTVVGRLPGKNPDIRSKAFSIWLILLQWLNILAVADRVSTGIVIADIDFSLIDSVRTKMPIDKVKKRQIFNETDLCFYGSNG